MGNLNLDDVPVEPIYKPFEARYVDAMPAVRAEGRGPMPVSALMKRRLQVLESKNEDLIENWWGNYYDSPDGIANFKQEYKVVKNAELLLSINKKSKLQNGALILTEKQYDTLKGETFSRAELEKAGINDWMPKDKVIEHPVWNAFAPKDLLKNYADAQFKKYNNTTAMGVYISNPQDTPTMRALVLYGGGGVIRRSFLLDGRSLDYYGARLVGVREKILEELLQK